MDGCLKLLWLDYEEDKGMFCSLCIKFRQVLQQNEVWVIKDNLQREEYKEPRENTSGIHFHKKVLNNLLMVST